MTCGSMRRKPMSGNALLLSLGLALISACGPTVASSNYKATIPELTAHPQTHRCDVNGMPTMCVCFVKSDAEQLIRRLKAACLALGGTHDECQTNNQEEESR